MPNATAIYAGISLDRAGDALGTLRQLANCRAEAERRGWPVAEEYVDDDTSAYSGKVPPGHRRMLGDIHDGHIDALLGFEDDKVTIRESEAAIIRELAGRFLAGEPVTSLTGWLNAQEIPTSTGRTRWRATTMREMLRNGRLSPAPAPAPGRDHRPGRVGRDHHARADRADPRQAG
jgi:hypothetical protein